MNADQAFSAYENVRHRLPDMLRNGACVRAQNLDTMADQFDVFLLDAFGVLNIGETAIEGVPGRVKRLQNAGKRVLVVSNAAANPHCDLMAKYTRLGYHFDPDDVITSRKATLAALEHAPRWKWGLMATPDFGHRDLDPYNMSYLNEDLSVYDAVDAFLLLGSGQWTQDRQTLLKQSLRAKPRPVYIANPDIVAPRDTGFSIEPGSFAHDLANATDITPQFFGKPFGNIYDLTFARLGQFDPARTVMVGDSLHTDILGGQAAGLKTALIAGFGFFAGQDVDAAIATSGIQPDFILDRP